MPNSSHTDFMHRCLQLAANGLGRTRPNPLVGCVIVSEDEVISEGYHCQHGQNHAERNAILNCREPQRIAGSTLYVNLEPCSHFGLTPPCADLIVERGVSRVVSCNDDPNPKVAGNGYRRLREAGIEVVTHVLEDEGRFLNRRFFTFQEKQRPYVILKWAQTADGFLDPWGCHGVPADSHYWITNAPLRQLCHKWRTEEAAILIGSQTLINDSPQLNARLWKGNDPQPVVLDRRGRLVNVPSHWLHLDSPTPQAVLQELYRHNIQSVIIEGGRQTLEAFLNTEWQGGAAWDEIRLLQGSCLFGQGTPAPQLPPSARPHPLAPRRETYLNNNVFYYYNDPPRSL